LRLHAYDDPVKVHNLCLLLYYRFFQLVVLLYDLFSLELEGADLCPKVISLLLEHIEPLVSPDFERLLLELLSEFFELEREHPHLGSEGLHEILLALVKFGLDPVVDVLCEGHDFTVQHFDFFHGQ
jgi:hypothetical protein